MSLVGRGCWGGVRKYKGHYSIKASINYTNWLLDNIIQHLKLNTLSESRFFFFGARKIKEQYLFVG